MGSGRGALRPSSVVRTPLSPECTRGAMGCWRGEATGNADEAARALGLSETGAMVGSSNSSSKSDVLEPDEI